MNLILFTLFDSSGNSEKAPDDTKYEYFQLLLLRCLPYLTIVGR